MKTLFKITLFITIFVYLTLNLHSSELNLSPRSSFTDNSYEIQSALDLLKFFGLNDSLYGKEIFGIPIKDWVNKHGKDITPVATTDRYRSVDDDPYKHEYAFIIRDSPGIKDAKKRILSLAKRYFDDNRVKEIETLLESVKLKHLKIAKKRFRRERIKLTDNDEKIYNILRNIANEVSHPPIFLTKGFTHLYSDWKDNDVPLWNLKIWMVDDNGKIQFDEMKKWLNSQSKKPTLAWYKALNNDRVKSFYELFDYDIFKKNELSDEKVEKFLPYVWVDDEGIHIRKNNEVHLFKTLFDAVRSTFIHEIDSVINDLRLLIDTERIISNILDVNINHSANFSSIKEEILNIRKNIGVDFKNNWGEAKKSSWEFLELAINFINQGIEKFNNFESKFKEAKTNLNQLVREKKSMILRIRNGRIKAIKNEIDKRNSLFEKHIHSLSNLINEKKYKEAKSKTGYLLSLWNSYKLEPDFNRMNNSLGFLINLLSSESKDLLKINNIFEVISKQIKDSNLMYEFLLDYVDRLIKTSFESNITSTIMKNIFETTFDNFIVKHSLLGEDARERAIMWAKFNVALNISYLNENNLYKAASLYIRIIEYSQMPEILLGNKNLMTSDKLHTKKAIDEILKYRKKLLREDLPYIVEALSKDFSLNDKEKNKLFECILPEKRKQPLNQNYLKYAA